MKINIKRLYKIISVILLISLALIAISCSAKKEQQQAQTLDLKSLTPEQAVKEFYKAWGTFDFKAQYALIDDNFKQLEPSAKDLETFSNYMLAFFGEGKTIEPLEASQTYFDGREAKVGYRIKLVNKDNTEKIQSGIQALKLTGSGWKLVAPYGDKVKVD